MRERFSFTAAVAAAVVMSAGLLSAPVASATPLGTTLNDFKLPGTQPLTITDNLSVPSDCTGCHSGYGSPLIEPYRTWQGSMVAQAGRDPLFWAALGVAEQDAPASGETCLRCHMGKGWLEGRSATTSGAAMTADDREGVQCSVCHRMVDPAGNPGAPAEDAAILAALTDPVTVVGGGQMVIDPDERIRGPFTLGVNPHAPDRDTLVSPFHRSSELCGTCHNVLNPVFERNMLGEYDVTAMDTPGDPSKAFPEQQTYTEWLLSDYAGGGVIAPQFAGDGAGVAGDYEVSTCQDCHMPKVSGKAAGFGATRPDMPAHDLVGANTLAPAMIPLHPVFGSEVDAGILAEGITRATRMLRRSATISGSIDSGNLTVRVTNETGHKLPTGYPEGRRLWLHVRALDRNDNVVLESGSYDFATAELYGYEALPLDPDYDANLHVWETHQSIGPNVALASGLPTGTTFHIALNNVREFDNRIPPRGFTNAAFEAEDAQPVGQAYADGEYWDDVVYPVGADAVRAEVILYYQTASKEYIEFLRDEDMTGAGTTLHTLWEAVDKGPPVEVARLTVDTNPKVAANCRKNIDKLQSKYFKTYLKEWDRCYAAEAASSTCDTTRRDDKIGKADDKLRDRLGGVDDKKCTGKGLSPSSTGLGSYCPIPCSSIVLFSFSDVADCGACLAESVADATLDAAYGSMPPATPAAVPLGDSADCQKRIGKASSKLGQKWGKARMKCEADNSTGKNSPAVNCATDPGGKVGKAQTSAATAIDKCSTLTGIAGCADGAGTPADAYQCIEDAIDALIADYPSAAYP